MGKRIISAALCVTLLLGLWVPACAAGEDGESYQGSVPAEIVVDGAVLEYRGQLLNGTTRVSLREIALALCPEAEAELEEGSLTVTGEGFALTAKVGCKYFEVNGRPLYVAEGLGEDEAGGPMAPVRTLAAALGAQVGWDGRVLLTTGGEPLESADTFYNATDLDLISRVIMHESGNQSLEGKIAVGNVILNRVNDTGRSFPDTVKGVLDQKNQFPGATKVSYVNRESLVAAKLALEGVMIVPGACWFNRKGLTCWASRNKNKVATIGNHDFYG